MYLLFLTTIHVKTHKNSSRIINLQNIRVAIFTRIFTSYFTFKIYDVYDIPAHPQLSISMHTCICFQAMRKHVFLSMIVKLISDDKQHWNEW